MAPLNLVTATRERESDVGPGAPVLRGRISAVVTSAKGGGDLAKSGRMFLFSFCRSNLHTHARIYLQGQDTACTREFLTLRINLARYSRWRRHAERTSESLGSPSPSNCFVSKRGRPSSGRDARSYCLAPSSIAHPWARMPRDPASATAIPPTDKREQADRDRVGADSAASRQGGRGSTHCSPFWPCHGRLDPRLVRSATRPMMGGPGW